MKERITITIASDLLTEIDNKIDGTNIKNRSHAIELFLAKSKRDISRHARSATDSDGQRTTPVRKDIRHSVPSIRRGVGTQAACIPLGDSRRH